MQCKGRDRLVGFEVGGGLSLLESRNGPRRGHSSDPGNRISSLATLRSDRSDAGLKAPLTEPHFRC
jgi:hypothetical protein